MPGDAPMGMRLPLEALPDVAADEREPATESSLFEPRAPLGDVHGEVAMRYSQVLARAPAMPGLMEQGHADMHRERLRQTAAKVVRTAICVEPRDGRLCVFLPPLAYLEHYLDLVAAVEAAAEALRMPVALEGYEPPRDSRLERLLVTPDPGVIEVNVHPSRDWPGLVAVTTALYEEAHLARLGTEKFMLDGRHTGPRTAITSRSAAPPRPTARSCGGPICFGAS